MLTQLFTGGDRERARAFIERQGLSFEPPFDELLGVFEGEDLVATGARDGAVLKMVAVEPSRQGGSLLGELVTGLLERATAAGHESVLVFTRPGAAGSFEALNFDLLASCGRAALLEYGRGFRAYLEQHRSDVRAGVNGAVVMNCNPFTRGHRHLVEHAAARVSTLYVFVVREDRSAFPFDVRMRLVCEGTRDLANVRVLDTSHYAVSAATFPAYFLKRTDDAAEIQMELDAVLFAQRIAPFFGIRRRYFGTEPLCATTGAYNAAMQRVLPPLGVDAVEVQRIEAHGIPISASAVRDAMLRVDAAALDALVPETTREFLASPAAVRIQERLRGPSTRQA